MNVTKELKSINHIKISHYFNDHGIESCKYKLKSVKVHLGDDGSDIISESTCAVS